MYYHILIVNIFKAYVAYNKLYNFKTLLQMRVLYILLQRNTILQKNLPFILLRERN